MQFAFYIHNIGYW